MIYIVITVIFILFVLVNIYISKNLLKITKYSLTNSKLPNNFNNFKIVHISDVHCKLFGKNNKKFIEKVKSINPDIIIMSGDIIDDKCRDINYFVECFKELYNNYPTYYALGNHEFQLGEKRLNKYIKLLRDNEVNVINNGSIYYYKGNSRININIIEYKENIKPAHMTAQEYIELIGGKLNICREEFNILIAHDPENFELYEKLKVDLIFSGHVHGGLIRFGKVCLLSPRRKLFPKYSYGVNRINDTTIITSSGLGDATIPIRLFNRPEIVEVTLKNR